MAAGMDDLISGMMHGFDVSGDKFNTSAPHPRFSAYYKNQGWSKEESQAKRRNELLEQQQMRRLDRQMHARGLALGDFDEVDHDGVEEETSMDTSGSSARTYGYRKPSVNDRHKDQLMLSEWMVDVPEDLETNWTAVACPEGRRSLVVAFRGGTTAYSKSGWSISTFQSCLPGGSRKTRGGKQGYTLLDCIYVEAENCFVVLDVLYWGQPTMDSDTAFRFFWLQSRMNETPDLVSLNKYNACKFIAAPTCAASKTGLTNLMLQTFPFTSKLDGVLFYLNEAHYWQGRTPLVLWLKPFMLPEMLGVSVPKELTEGHENQTAAEFRQEFAEEEKVKTERRKEKEEERKTEEKKQAE